MASYNRVVLVGNLTRDVDLRYTPSQTAVTDIGLSVNDRVKRNNEWVDETTFVDVTLWGRQAEVANEYLSKGAPVLIEGRLKLDTWEQEGQKRSKLRVVGEKMQMLGSRSGGGSGGGQSGGGSRPQSGGQMQPGGQGDYAGAGYGDVPMSGPGDDDVPF
ncbi:MAG: single-stranded DNA-binding protein [Pirellulaceae bacterium]|jgi:single-strand DNA-binding protein|nr:single-stranded DNA-binding protein [Pirellulaceae bacterium]